MPKPRAAIKMPHTLDFLPMATAIALIPGVVLAVARDAPLVRVLLPRDDGLGFNGPPRMLLHRRRAHSRRADVRPLLRPRILAVSLRISSLLPTSSSLNGVHVG